MTNWYEWLAGATKTFQLDDETARAAGALADAIDAVLQPEIPPEVHNPRPIDPEACVAATRAMCG